MSEDRLFEILLVEDSPADVRLTVEALDQARVRHKLHVAEDGEAALAFLRDPLLPRPDLVLLDLHLPGLDGREVLAEIKTDPALHSIPVIVLTASSSPDEIETAYRNHANCCVVKPIDLHQFILVVQQVNEFWFSIAHLPPRAG